MLNDVRDVGNGIVNAAVDLAVEQRRRGRRVLVGSAGGEHEPLLEREGVEHLHLPRVREPAALLPAARALRRVVRAEDVGIVHAHMNYSTVLGSASVVGTCARLVATAHTSFKPGAAALRLAERVVVFSGATHAQMRRRGVPAGRLRVIANGTAGAARLSGGTVSPAPEVTGGRTVLCVAGLYRRKGVDLLLRAFDGVAAALPEVQLLVAGAGPQDREFAQQAAGLVHADRVRLLGFRDDVQALLAGSDVLVLPSRDDPFPLVLLEARAAGCAVIGTAVGGIPDALDWGRAGWLVPPEDPVALGEALLGVLSDPAALSSWRERAARGAERFSVQRVAAEHDALYAELGC